MWDTSETGSVSCHFVCEVADSPNSPKTWWWAFYRMGFKRHWSNQQHERPRRQPHSTAASLNTKHAGVTRGVQQILHRASLSGLWPSTQAGIFSISHRFLRVVQVWPGLGLLWLQGN